MHPKSTNVVDHTLELHCRQAQDLLGYLIYAKCMGDIPQYSGRGRWVELGSHRKVSRVGFPCDITNPGCFGIPGEYYGLALRHALLKVLSIVGEKGQLIALEGEVDNREGKSFTQCMFSPTD
jgi:hypothetical protein